MFSSTFVSARKEKSTSKIVSFYLDYNLPPEIWFFLSAFCPYRPITYIVEEGYLNIFSGPRLKSSKTQSCFVSRNIH